MAVVPSPSDVRTTIRARQTCFCGLLRLRMIVSSRTRSSAVTVMEIPLRITDTRTKPNLQKLLFGLFCQVLSTRVFGVCRRPGECGNSTGDNDAAPPTAPFTLRHRLSISPADGHNASGPIRCCCIAL